MLNVKFCPESLFATHKGSRIIYHQCEIYYCFKVLLVLKFPIGLVSFQIVVVSSCFFLVILLALSSFSYRESGHKGTMLSFSVWMVEKKWNLIFKPKKGWLAFKQLQIFSDSSRGICKIPFRDQKCHKKIGSIFLFVFYRYISSKKVGWVMKSLSLC